MKLEFSTLAEIDLVGIFDFIAKNNPINALNYLQKIEEACFKLTDYPTLFPIYKIKDGSHYHIKPFQKYLIYYNFNETTVTIHRVIHGARNQNKQLN